MKMKLEEFYPDIHTKDCKEVFEVFNKLYEEKCIRL